MQKNNTTIKSSSTTKQSFPRFSDFKDQTSIQFFEIINYNHVNIVVLTTVSKHLYLIKFVQNKFKLLISVKITDIPNSLVLIDNQILYIGYFHGSIAFQSMEKIFCNNQFHQIESVQDQPILGMLNLSKKQEIYTIQKFTIRKYINQKQSSIISVKIQISHCKFVPNYLNGICVLALKDQYWPYVMSGDILSQFFAKNQEEQFENYLKKKQQQYMADQRVQNIEFMDYSPETKIIAISHTNKLIVFSLNEINYSLRKIFEIKSDSLIKGISLHPNSTIFNFISQNNLVFYNYIEKKKIIPNITRKTEKTEKTEKIIDDFKWDNQNNGYLLNNARPAIYCHNMMPIAQK